jgi:transcriptional regulator with XRE-family HTH domain
MGGVERGERNISALNLIKIAKALNVEVGELFPSIRSL